MTTKEYLVLFIAMGDAISIILSFSVNHSILWMIGHGLIGWIYVIYRAIVGGY